MRILDSHLHLVHQDRFPYPWFAAQEKLNRNWTAQSYFDEAEALGIDRALHVETGMEADLVLAEAEFVLRADPRIVGAVAGCRPEDPAFPAFLERMPPGVRGLRRLLQFQPPELSQSATFIANLNRLPALGLPFDICVKSHELAIARRLVPACPDVQFVLDHGGNPKIEDGEWEVWLDHVGAIAASPNVVCKISGLLDAAGDGWSVDSVRPYVETIIDRFGWDRVLWGSDHPVVTLHGSLTRWVDATRAIVAGASEEEQEKLFFRNAERIYGIGPA